MQRWTFLALAACLALPSLSQAQGMVQRNAVGSCQSINDDSEIEYSGGTYLIATNTPAADFWCPIDASLAPPGAISEVTVWVGDASPTENVRVELCYTDLSGTPGEVCGRPAFSSGQGYFTQAVTAFPPNILVTKNHVAFIKVAMPAYPMGYSYLRGFRVK